MKYIGSEEQLQDLGFIMITQEYCDLNNLDELEHLDGCWCKESGEGRRGQSYYLIIGSIDKTLYITSTQPDGSGTIGELGDELFYLISKGLVQV